MASAKKTSSSLKLSTGLLLRDDRLVAAVVTRRAVGFKLVETVEAQVVEGDISAAVGKLVEDGKIRGRVVCSVDAARVFSITRRLSPEEAQLSPNEILSSRLGQIEGGLAGAIESVKLPRGAYQRLIACRRETVLAVLRGLKGIKRTRIRLAPLIPILFDQALKSKATPRKWKAHVRVLIGPTDGIALLAFGRSLLASRRFTFAAGSFIPSVETAVLSLVTEAREELAISAVQGIVMHVGDTGGEIATECELATGLPTEVAPKLELDDQAASLALAVAGLRPKPGAVNLFTELLPPPGLRHNFPVKAAAMLVLTLVVSGWMLADEAGSVEREATRLEQKAVALAKRLKTTTNDLAAEHAKLTKEMEIAHGFIMNRLFWTEFLKEMPEILPRSVSMTDFDGRDTVQPWKKNTGTTGNAGRKLSISGQVLMDGSNVSPPEVHQITSSLKRSKLFSERLPSITGANVRLSPGAEGLLARIVVVCLPKGI